VQWCGIVGGAIAVVRRDRRGSGPAARDRAHAARLDRGGSGCMAPTRARKFLGMAVPRNQAGNWRARTSGSPIIGAEHGVFPL